MRPFSLSALRDASLEEARERCEALREELWETVHVSGGHLASNLGIVEIAVGLLRVLDLSHDRILYDTGHQCYVHKMLTRDADFSRLRALGGPSGFPCRSESPFDPFGTGHSGTGLSAALGFAAADRLNGKDGVTAVVLGDGAFGNGMVFEALNNVHPNDRVILILNDNGMSISKSTGRLKSVLGAMRTHGYYRFKDRLERGLRTLPRLRKALQRTKDYLKRSAVPQGNLFEQYGLHYFGPADGNDLSEVEFLLREAKKKARPCVIHLCTKKGKGKREAEEDPSRYHGISPASSEKETESFSRLFGQSLCRLAAEDESILAVTAAMTDGVGLGDFAARFPQRFFDVGIAEEHAATFAAGLAAAGKKSVFAVYSTFFQRAFDQLLHDCALQKLPVTFCLDRAGLVGEDGATHHGLFDLPLCLSVPEVKIYHPVTARQMEFALKRALARENGPTVIRYHKGAPLPLTCAAFDGKDEIAWVDLGEGEERMALVSFGRTVEALLAAACRLMKRGYALRVICFSSLKGFDPTRLDAAFADCTRLFFAEEGILSGGFSQHLFAALSQRGLTDGKKTRFVGIDECFVPHGKTDELLSLCGLTDGKIEKEVENFAKT